MAYTFLVNINDLELYNTNHLTRRNIQQQSFINPSIGFGCSLMEMSVKGEHVLTSNCAKILSAFFRLSLRS